MGPAERLAELAEGRSQRLISRMRSGFAVLHETQFLEGYCLLLAYPQVENLNRLSVPHRTAFLEDMAHLGDAIIRATDCVRVNYSIYGNLDPFLHAHLVPRFAHEPEEFRTIPPLSYPESIRNAPEFQFDIYRHKDLIRAIRTHLEIHTPEG